MQCRLLTNPQWLSARVCSLTRSSEIYQSLWYVYKQRRHLGGGGGAGGPSPPRKKKKEKKERKTEKKRKKREKKKKQKEGNYE